MSGASVLLLLPRMLPPHINSTRQSQVRNAEKLLPLPPRLPHKHTCTTNTPARVTSPSSELPNCPGMLSHGLWHGMAMARSLDIRWSEVQVFSFSLIAASLGPRSACATRLFSEFGEVINAKTIRLQLISKLRIMTQRSGSKNE